MIIALEWTTQKQCFDLVSYLESMAGGGGAGHGHIKRWVYNFSSKNWLVLQVWDLIIHLTGEWPWMNWIMWKKLLAITGKQTAANPVFGCGGTELGTQSTLFVVL